MFSAYIDVAHYTVTLFSSFKLAFVAEVKQAEKERRCVKTLNRLSNKLDVGVFGSRKGYLSHLLLQFPFGVIKCNPYFVISFFVS